MQLEDSIRFHHILAIKEGLVVKTPNVDSHEKLTLKFKQIKAIYEYEEANKLSSCSTQLQFGCSMKEIGRITVKREPATCAFSEDSGDEESNYNWDNLSFNTMTLKELKERYKVKKRKVPLFEDSIKEDAEICRKSDYSTVESKENESDIEELLSSFKLRVSKKPKAKRKCLSVKTPTEQVPSSSTYSLQTVRDKHVTYIKSEIVEPDFSDRQNMVCAVDVSITDSNDECSDDMPDSVNNCVMKMETWETTSITEDNSRYDVSRVLLKILEQVHPSLSASTVVIADIRERSIINHQLPCISFTEATPVTNDQSFEICEKMSRQDNIIMVGASDMVNDSVRQEPLNYGCDGCVSDIDCSDVIVEDNPYDIVGDLLCNNVMTQIPEMPITANLKCIELNLRGNGFILDTDGIGDYKEDTPSDPVPVRQDPLNYSCDGCVSNINCSDVIVEDNPCDAVGDLMCNNVVRQIPEMPITANLECVELNLGGDGYILDTDGMGDYKYTPSNPDPNVNNVLDNICISSHDLNPVINARNVSETHSSDAIGEIKYGETFNDHCGVKLECPKRLFMSRKAISPTSQEKLRQALDGEELYENIRSPREFSGKVRLKKKTKNKNAILSSDLEKAEMSVTSNSKMKNGCPPSVLKGILKLPDVSCAESSSVQTCAQKAISFSQRQMLDIESLATKLVNELKSMTELVAETLDSSVDLSTSSDHAVDMMRASIESAKGAEETTRKWLSMMAKDCNRFCKIMRSTGKKNTDIASGDANKVGKKITFADEAGEVLCHIKVIEDPANSPSCYGSLS